MNDNTSVDPGDHDAIEGTEHVETVRLIDQSPIGRTPRSNPATYTGIFDYIREKFAQTKLATQRGYKKGGSRSTSKAAGVRPVAAREPRRST